MTAATPHIVFEDVSYSYEGVAQQPALDGVGFSVAPGEYIALVGANGSGKSTLSKMVNALIAPSTGRVLTLGIDTTSEDEDIIFDLRSQAGLVLQNPDSQIVASIVSDDVAFGPENLAVPHNEIVERVDGALDDVKMTDYSLADPSRLSGGQKQRVCIAGLLAMRPKVLVLDEPGAMLDIRGRRGIRRVLAKLHEAGLTVVLVTHFMEEAALAQRVVVLNEGKVFLQGAPRDVFSEGSLLRQVGLDVPFSVQLAFALRERGFEVPNIASPRELIEIFEVLLAAKGLNKGTLDPASHEEEQEANHLGSSVVLPSAEPSGAVLPPPEPAASEDPVIVLKDVSYRYATSNTGNEDIPALDRISLILGRGELLGVVGHTGSGKTTLLRIIAGLLPASSGYLQVAGVEFSKKRKNAAVHGKVGMVFQYPERQLFAKTVAEDIAFGPTNAGLDAHTIDARVHSVMEQVGLDYDEYAQRSPFELSGGEKRRVAIAGVIVMDPEVLIFDEPTAGLDVRGQHEIQGLIDTLRARGKTIILTSHSLDAIAQLSSAVAVLNQGQLVMLGSPGQVFCRAHEPQLKRINLGLPQTAEFARLLEDRGLPLPDGLFSIDALADAIVGALGGVEHGA